jgi:hypothetical protein
MLAYTHNFAEEELEIQLQQPMQPKQPAALAARSRAAGLLHASL